MMKTDRTKKADVKFVSKKKVYSELDFSDSNPSLHWITAIRKYQREVIH